jgi:hypothetical protein
MEYRFVVLREAAWAALVALAIVVLEAFVTFDPTAITDWTTWAVAIGAGGVRAAAAAVLAGFTKGFVLRDESAG